MSRLAAQPPGQAGLQAERTALAWSRTALGLLGNGALLLLRGYHAARPAVTVALAAVALLLAGAAALVARLRSREFARTPLPAPLAAPRRICALGIAVAILCLLTGAGLLW